MSDRCTGHCCRAFVLGCRSPEELATSEANFWRREGVCDIFGWVEADCVLHTAEDIGWWLPWMKHLGKFTENPTDCPGVEQSPTGYDYYTCTQLSDSGDCKVYKQRPHFCRSYGIECACRFPGCTWKGAKRK